MLQQHLPRASTPHPGAAAPQGKDPFAFMASGPVSVFSQGKGKGSGKKALGMRREMGSSLHESSSLSLGCSRLELGVCHLHEAHSAQPQHSSSLPGLGEWMGTT